MTACARLHVQYGAPCSRVLWRHCQHRLVICNGLVKATQRLQHHTPCICVLWCINVQKSRNISSAPVKHGVHAPWTQLHAGVVVLKGLRQTSLPTTRIASVAQGAAHHIGHPGCSAVTVAVNQLRKEGFLLLCA